jgi:pimeloyl-ACP methyl ester carboxylesterase
MQPKSFTINISEDTLNDLKRRLKETRFPNKSQDAGWSNGTDLTYMKDLVDYWQHTYDWRKAEKEINSFDNYTVAIDEIDIHFIHQKSKKANAQAIILTHGWPDSFYRFHEVISLLAEEYDVIVPSLPGFGFSSPRAMASKDVANLWAKLMTESLGYETFLAAGGDLGSGVTIALARDHGDVVKAIHLTDVGWDGNQPDASTLTKDEKAYLDKTGMFYMTEGSYIMMHSMKPLTVAYGVNDSPAGLAAWAASFANNGNDHNYVDTAFGGRDAFLTNMTIYWATHTAGSAMQMYREEVKAAFSVGAWSAPAEPAKIPTPVAIAIFPHDEVFPKEWAERKGLNVQCYTTLLEGGHFAAMDVPKLFANDIIDSFTKLA